MKVLERRPRVVGASETPRSELILVHKVWHPVQRDETGGYELGRHPDRARDVLRHPRGLLELRADDDEERREQQSERVAGHGGIERPRHQVILIPGH